MPSPGSMMGLTIKSLSDKPNMVAICVSIMMSGNVRPCSQLERACFVTPIRRPNSFCVNPSFRRTAIIFLPIVILSILSPKTILRKFGGIGKRGVNRYCY